MRLTLSAHLAGAVLAVVIRGVVADLAPSLAISVGGAGFTAGAVLADFTRLGVVFRGEI